ncbi:MAG TPA: SDR family oxidoreductase [Hyphomicrobiales bacterium]|nr:SDR family oxidoreductase [Hyphomicrobiales bacterium]
MDLGLRGKKALVTGGTKGIGRAIADGFAAEGASVAICARNPAEIEAAVTALRGHGVTAFGRALDVADAASLKGWVADAAAALGGVDVLVCNVSAFAAGDNAESWEAAFRTDLMHSVAAVAAALPWLEASASASVTFIASVSGVEIDFAAGPYGAAKAALIHYSKALAHRLAPKGIRVNTVSPGNTYFEGGGWHRFERDAPDFFQAAMALNPTGRMGTPEEVADGVVFLASPRASRISGTNLVIDGALTRGV